jgi:hypothetical protein
MPFLPLFARLPVAAKAVRARARGVAARGASAVANAMCARRRQATPTDARDAAAA